MAENRAPYPARPSGPPPAHTPPPPPTISTNPDPFLRLKESWRIVVDACKGKGQKLKIDALLRSGRLLSLEGDLVTIGFPTPFFIDKMNSELENPGTRVAMEEAFAKVLGIRPKVKCVISTKEERPAGTASGGGHLLKAAMEEAGAKIVGGESEP